MALAAIAAGADAVMIDVLPDPEAAFCDGPQALLPYEIHDLGGSAASPRRWVARDTDEAISPARWA